MDQRQHQATLACTFTWLGAVIVAGLLAFFGAGATGEVAFWGLGLTFAAAFIVVRRVAARVIDLRSWIAAAVASVFGVWAPLFLGVAKDFVNDQLIAPGILESSWSAAMTHALAITVGGGAMTALLSFATRSANVLALNMLATALAVTASFLPMETAMVLPASAVVWMMLSVGGVCQWALSSVRRENAGCCSGCGRDIVGISSPICPSCAFPISNPIPYGATCPVDGVSQARPKGLG